MKETAGAIQDLMRDTARLFDQARKLNSQLLQIDAFLDKDGTRSLLEGLEHSKRQYQASLDCARGRIAALGTGSLPEAAAKADCPADTLEALVHERDRLREVSVAKAKEIHRLLGCMRQVQLVSAQLIQM
ncbi:hypothetical protein GGF46_001111 [Coemansia sp. RSA 552]|nr:hypothetical protein GGF46_001111 [Coemansia sp. RSA 552]